MGEAKIASQSYCDARKQLLEAEEILTREAPDQLGQVFFLLAKANLFLASYEESKDYFQKALSFFESRNNLQMAANSYLV